MYNGPGGEIEETQAAADITATAGRESHQTLCHSICDQIRGSSTTGIRMPRKMASMMAACTPTSTTAYGAKIMPSASPATRWMTAATRTRPIRDSATVVLNRSAHLSLLKAGPGQGVGWGSAC